MRGEPPPVPLGSGTGMRDGGGKQGAAPRKGGGNGVLLGAQLPPHSPARGVLVLCHKGQDATKPISCPSPAELDMIQLSIMGLATVLTLVSVGIYVEEALYLTHKIRCPIKMKTLRWSSSAPTVSWGWGWWGGGHPRGLSTPPGGRGEAVCHAHVSPQVVAVFSCFGLWIPRSMMVVEMATTM